jgi:hypothetical protein
MAGPRGTVSLANEFVGAPYEWSYQNWLAVTHGPPQIGVQTGMPVLGAR